MHTNQRKLALRIGDQLERRASWRFYLGLALLASSSIGHAGVLPYATRTRSYSGATQTVRGDVRAVAMAGATTGIADSALAARDNPSGLAMGFEGVDVSLVTNFVKDGLQGDFGRPTYNNGLGAAFNLYPWGVSFGYFGRVAEDDLFELQSLPGRNQRLSVGTQDFSVAAARVFWDHRLALGIQFDFGQSVLKIEDPGGFSQQWLGSGFGATVGLSYQFRSKWILGLAYSSPRVFDGAGPGEHPTALPGFYQAIEIPFKISLGLGWKPNRFTAVDLTLSGYGVTPNAAQLRDERVSVGANFGFTPRFGLSYRLIDFPELDATFFAGTYLETPVVQDTFSRLHGTLGTRGRLWVVLFGAGVDVAVHYSNALFYVGVDVMRVIQKFDLVPELRMGAYGGIFPNPLKERDRGMPRPLVAQYLEPKPQERPPDAMEVMQDFPTKFGEKLEDWSGDPASIPQRLLKTIEEIPSKMGEELERMKEIQKNAEP